MEWYKLLGALLLSVSGGFGAYLANQRITATLRQTQAFEELLRYIRGQVDCFALPISRILAECSPSLLLACGYRAEGAPEDLDALLDGCAIRDEETAQILESFARTFGKSYREEQTKGCSYYCESLAKRRETLGAQLPNKRKVNTTLWISGALATVILLI